MRIDRYLPPHHWLSKIYRAGAAAFGGALIAFGILGFTNNLGFLSTSGTTILGLSTNGLLSLISVIVGAVLILAAALGGPLASTTTAVIGALFLLSGLANLAVLETGWNLLAFEMQNVVFSLVAGMLLLFVGLYGRISGGLPEDNPFVRYRHNEPPESEVPEQRTIEQQRSAELEPLAEAEVALGEGHASPEQERMVRAEAARLARAERQRAHEHYAHLQQALRDRARESGDGDDRTGDER
ncbi:MULTISPECIES: DUF4383 domain-containing protein [Actinopolyspora]|uniref:DUF4383 domain-containing protein n=1 Tax=Actinopolyspora saharensis TaxID=995062 RepID=A0A1H0XWK1_9ACTN|nr:MULTISPECIES: DUF4383 domain-containing protein [Actinopolyspora]NHD17375.1 DUF4383 domain-containing protein [Actinopolyspora sp. BKK2]NHE76892.1 DUF4383 domain-containing protein [Actinopolyspora sp. BKK1]SDQ07225.1 protein of unknown function [Actinopolyspora saharensis]